MRFILFLALPVLACPLFVEFFPDPVLVSDQEGEYVEIRLDDFRAESLYVAFEAKAALAFAYPQGSRFVLVHDSALCPDIPKVACGSLGSLSMPNSRESYWKLWAGPCSDSVYLPRPKEGKAFQRVRETDEWVLSPGSFGLADPENEVGIEDCGIGGFKALPEEGRWSLTGWLSGCDSATLAVSTLNLQKLGGWKFDSVRVSGKFQLDVAGEAAWVRVNLPRDDAPANDSLDTLLLRREGSPLVISEVHHCPQEPEPEWIEIYNGSRYAIPLSRVSLLGRSSALLDSILPFESVLLTRDSASLRDVLGYDDTRILQQNFGYLNNTSGFLLLAVDSVVVDSVAWDKNTAKCPSGFNPHTSLAENTPGFQGQASQKVFDTPVRYTLSSRVIRKKGGPLRIRVESESAVSLKLLDSTRREVWSMVVPPLSYSWWDVPAREKVPVGVGYVSFSVGEYASVVGFIVRP